MFRAGEKENATYNVLTEQKLVCTGIKIQLKPQQILALVGC